jgi:hypothetical protein
MSDYHCLRCKCGCDGSPCFCNCTSGELEYDRARRHEIRRSLNEVTRFFPLTDSSESDSDDNHFESTPFRGKRARPKTKSTGQLAIEALEKRIAGLEQQISAVAKENESLVRAITAMDTAIVTLQGGPNTPK